MTVIWKEAESVVCYLQGEYTSDLEAEVDSDLSELYKEGEVRSISHQIGFKMSTVDVSRVTTFILSGYQD